MVSTTAAASIAPSSVPTATNPGLCWLSFFRDDLHSDLLCQFQENPMAVQLQAYAAKNTGHYTSSTMSAQLGTPYGVASMIRRHVHVWRTDSEHSLLSAKDILFAIPPNYYIGAADPTDNIPPAPHQQQVTLAGIPASVPAAPELTISYVDNGLLIADPTHHNRELVRLIDFTRVQPVFQAVGSWPVSQLLSATVSIVPTMWSRKYHTNLALGWTPRNDSQPSSRDQVLMKSGSHYASLHSEQESGSFNTFSLKCPIGQDLISNFITPAAAVGGAPALALWAHPHLLPDATATPKDQLFELFFQLRVKIGL